MDHCGTIKLETKRLILRRFEESDAKAFYDKWASDPNVTMFLTRPTHTSIDVTRKVLQSWLPLYENKDYYHWVITLKERDNEPVGTIHGQVNDDLDLIQIGYCLGRAWWNKGIMTEAAQAVIRFFFEEVNANCICSYHDPNNPNSGKVMQHCNMTYEGTRRAADRNNTGICDASWYSILREEYKG